jgi:hypothetical protein
MRILGISTAACSAWRRLHLMRSAAKRKSSAMTQRA